MGTILRQLASRLGVATTASAGDLKLVIEGKIAEIGKDPANVMVTLTNVEGGVHVSLEDDSGVFHSAEPIADEATEEEHSPSDAGGHPMDTSTTRSEIVIERLHEEITSLTGVVEGQKSEIESQKTIIAVLWQRNHTHMAKLDDALTEIQRLKASQPGDRGSDRAVSGCGEEEGTPSLHFRPRRGKAPPVQPFTGEDPECPLDDWLPTLQRAAEWNGCGGDDLLLQLAGHLKGRTRQEWTLLCPAEKGSYDTAVVALRNRLDPGSKVMAAQDFRHTMQNEGSQSHPRHMTLFSLGNSMRDWYTV